MYELPICILKCTFYIHRLQGNYDKNTGGEEHHGAHSQGLQQIEGNDCTLHTELCWELPAWFQKP